MTDFSTLDLKNYKNLTEAQLLRIEEGLALYRKNREIEAEKAVIDSNLETAKEYIDYAGRLPPHAPFKFRLQTGSPKEIKMFELLLSQQGEKKVEYLSKALRSCIDSVRFDGLENKKTVLDYLLKTYPRLVEETKSTMDIMTMETYIYLHDTYSVNIKAQHYFKNYNFYNDKTRYEDFELFYKTFKTEILEDRKLASMYVLSAVMRSYVDLFESAYIEINSTYPEDKKMSYESLLSAKNKKNCALWNNYGKELQDILPSLKIDMFTHLSKDESFFLNNLPSFTANKIDKLTALLDMYATNEKILGAVLKQTKILIKRGYLPPEYTAVCEKYSIMQQIAPAKDNTNDGIDTSIPTKTKKNKI